MKALTSISKYYFNQNLYICNACIEINAQKFWQERKGWFSNPQILFVVEFVPQRQYNKNMHYYLNLQEVWRRMDIRIETKRLSIRPFDMKYLQEYYLEFNEEITRYQYPDPFASVSVAREVLQGFINQMNQEEMLFLSVFTRNGDFAGGIEVHGLQEQTPELGIWIKKQLQQKGYAYEALSGVLEFTDAHYCKDWYVYEADIRNEGSMKLVEKFDYKKEGEPDAFETETGKSLVLQRFLIKSN